MAKTKREYILATFFLSGAAAILSFVALGTQEWITSDVATSTGLEPNTYVKVGLFGGIFHQNIPVPVTFTLEMTCAWELNICALLCGNNPEDNLKKLYNGETVNNDDVSNCTPTQASTSFENRRITPRESNADTGKTFINTGAWFCTILFLIISGIMGLVSSALAVWNTATSPYQVYFSIFGLYIYNAVAFFAVLLSIVLWGAMFQQDLRSNIPTYKTFLEEYTTNGRALLGYSYWINLASLFLYMISISLLYIRNYLISKEPKVNLQLEDSADPVIYLY